MVAEKGFNRAFMINKLAMINSIEYFLEKLKKKKFAKNHYEI
jgi:hypothetical protein